jgi:tRNA nucleotidyltransferase (CCA-adding enzyme)
MGVIAANPSQSKHLETATMDVFGVDVDFCNLRSQEVYLPGSRIPTTEIGTPKEDAERRDFTINALYFNLRTDQVEDWTGRGLVDLRNGIIETPLNPHTTFHDDPLRVLRAIRFAVRYDFRLHEDLQKACMSQEVIDSLHLKVSRERVGKELEGMLTGKGAKPAKALDTIDRLGLSRSVFCLPNGIELEGSLMGLPHSKKEEDRLIDMGWEESRMLLTHIPPVYDAHEEAMESLDLPADATQVDDRMFHLAVFIMPFRHLTFTDRRGKQQPAVAHMFREGVKYKNKDVCDITTIVENVEQMMSILASASEGDVNAPLTLSRLDLGLLLRSTKEHWVTCLLVATIVKLREQTVGKHWTRLSQRVYVAIIEMNLDHCWKVKPLLNGRELIQIFELPFGPSIGDYLEEQTRWMLLNPDGTRDECEKHLRKFKHDLEHREAQEREAQQAAKKAHVEIKS